MLAATGVEDILVAYALTGPAQLHLHEMMERFPDTLLSVLVDHPDHLHGWSKISDVPIRMFIDIDVGLGRTGISPVLAADLYDRILDAGFEFCGLQIYDGNVVTGSPAERSAQIVRDFEPVEKLIGQIRNKHETDFEVVCGGSITFPVHAEFGERTLSPGTTLLWDHGYSSKFPDLPFVIAAVLLARVISKPGKGRVCVDLGHKAVASEMSDLRVFFPRLPDATRVIHSEEHLVLEVGDAEDVEIGEVLYGFPWHVCPTVALHEQAAVVEDHQVTGFWDIVARKRIYR